MSEYGECIRKVRYDSVIGAREAATMLKMRTYLCSYGSHWHLTSWPTPGGSNKTTVYAPMRRPGEPMEVQG